MGSDTGGSIREPGAFCNLVGFKPTYGRVSRYGLIAFASSLDQIGPLTRTVEDAALAYDAMAGYDPMDATSIDRPVEPTASALREDLRGLRIGIVREFDTKALGDELDAHLSCGLSRSRAAWAPSSSRFRCRPPITASRPTI